MGGHGRGRRQPGDEAGRSGWTRLEPLTLEIGAFVGVGEVVLPPPQLWV